MGQQLRRSRGEVLDRLIAESNHQTADLIHQLLSREILADMENYANPIHALQSRMAINRAHHNTLAVQRDAAKVQFLQLAMELARYLHRSWAVAHGYQKMGGLMDEIRAALQRLADSKRLVNHVDLEKVDVPSKLKRQLRENFHDLDSMIFLHKSLLGYLAEHPELVMNRSWTRYLTMQSWIDLINSYDLARRINLHLNIFDLDVGAIVLFVALFMAVVLLYPLLFKLLRRMLESRLLDADGDDDRSDNVKGFIYLQLRQPIRYLIVYFGLDLSIQALFYRNDALMKWSGDLAFVVLTLLLFWLFLRLLDTVVSIKVEDLNQADIGMRKELFNLVIHIIKILAFSMVCIVILMHFGISVAAILSTLGIGGLAFALAAKDTLANFFGGIAILMDDLFQLGDWVKIKDSEGTVAEIGLRSTTIRTFDNALITIPNAQVSTLDVMNWSKRRVGRRIKMMLQVTYESDPADVQAAIEEIRALLVAHPAIANPTNAHVGRTRRMTRFYKQEDLEGIKTTQMVYLDRFGDYSIDILLYCFSTTIDWQQWLAVKEELLYSIADIFKHHRVEFAYPTTEIKYARGLDDGG